MRYVTKQNLIDILSQTGGSGSGSSSVNATIDTLWSSTLGNVTANDTINLSEDITNYDYVWLEANGHITELQKSSSTTSVWYYFATLGSSFLTTLLITFTNATTGTATIWNYGTSVVTTMAVAIKGIKFNQSSASDFVGATSSVNGQHGLVPAPTTADKDSFLKGDGTWAAIAGGNVNAVVDTLWTGTAYTDGDTLNLTSAYTNYDYILTYLGLYQNSTYQCYGVGTINTSHMSKGSVTGSLNYGSLIQYSAFMDFSGGTTATLNLPYNVDQNAYIYKIEGIKLLNSNVYSTSEQRIGTWIDNKPLYQKTFTGTFGTITASNTVLQEYHEDLSSLNIDKTVDIKGVVTESGGVAYSGTTFTGNTSTFNKEGAMNFAVQQNSNDNNKLYLYTDIGSWYSECNFICTIKYTKTTD